MKRLSCFLLLVLLVSVPLRAGEPGPGDDERAALVDEFSHNLHQFIVIVDGLTPAQWNYRAEEGRWTLAEVAEHIILSETYLFDSITGGVLGTEPRADYTADMSVDEMVRGGIRDRSNKVQTTDPLKPSGLYATPAEAIHALISRRAKTIAFIESTDKDLRAHVMAHPFGMDLDGHQWLLFMVGHADRHLAQMKEVMAHEGYASL